jgi:hypothetical protein
MKRGYVFLLAIAILVLAIVVSNQSSTQVNENGSITGWATDKPEDGCRPNEWGPGEKEITYVFEDGNSETVSFAQDGSIIGGTTRGLQIAEGDDDEEPSSVIVQCIRRVKKFGKNAAEQCVEIGIEVVKFPITVLNWRPEWKELPIPPTTLEVAIWIYKQIEVLCPWDFPLVEDPNHCENELMDEDETGIDCGGNDCPTCPEDDAFAMSVPEEDES